MEGRPRVEQLTVSIPALSFGRIGPVDAELLGKVGPSVAELLSDGEMGGLPHHARKGTTGRYRLQGTTEQLQAATEVDEE